METATVQIVWAFFVQLSLNLKFEKIPIWSWEKMLVICFKKSSCLLYTI